MRGWYERYLGRPWEAAPSPPESYNCGELLRAVHRDRFGIDTNAITADATRLSECVRAFVPGLFGLRPLEDGERPGEFDCCFFFRARHAAHCGIAVETADGLLIMHCLESGGVVMESPMEALGRGFARLEWFRHRDFGGADWPGRDS